MTKEQRKEKLRREYCPGCHENFYNCRGGDKECWGLRDAKVVWKYRIGIHEIPPYKNKKRERVLDCYHERGYVFVDRILKELKQ